MVDPVYYEVPPRLRGGLYRFLMEGVGPGGFLHAVLSNNLRDAVAQGDPESLAALRAIVLLVHNKMPHACHGDPNAVRAWMRAKGWIGRHGTASLPPDWDLPNEWVEKL